MPIPESQLDTWSKQGSITQSCNTYNSIKKVLESSSAPYADKDFSVFLQGSYGNDTNIYAESDVDIVIQLHSCFYYNIESLPISQQSLFKQIHTGGVFYDFSYFKRDVLSHLTNIYGNAAITGDKAIKIFDNGVRRNVDVVVSMDFRNYHSFISSYDQHYVDGMCFFNSSNTQICNYPKIHSLNCTSKHQRTNGWYKPTVRIFKYLRSRLIQEKMINAGDAPSYFLEGLLYNVPDSNYGISYVYTIVNAINWLNKADQSQLVCANEQYYSLNNTSPVTWRADKCTAFLDVACNLWRQW
jgi:hypothetical protein